VFLNKGIYFHPFKCSITGAVTLCALVGRRDGRRQEKLP